MLLRVTRADVSQVKDVWRLQALGEGERLDRERHQLLVDVKAVTLHDFRLEPTKDGWRAHVILDI